MYLTNKEFEASLIAYQDDPTNEENQVRLWKNFHLLAKNVVRAWKLNDADREDMASCALIVIWSKVDRWDRTKGKAFNYFTTLVFNSMRQSARTTAYYEKLIASVVENQPGRKTRNLPRREP